MTPERSKTIAADFLAEALPKRWTHVQAVAARAEQIGRSLFQDSDRQTLVASAWLHDIGYSPSLSDTGFHPVDGANWLRQNGVDDRLCSLVVHHSCGAIEAEIRGLTERLQPFTKEESLVADVLTFCDMTTGPLGQSFTVSERIAEIKSRYKEGPVFEFVVLAEPDLLLVAERVQLALQNTSAQY